MTQKQKNLINIVALEKFLKAINEDKKVESLKNSENIRVLENMIERLKEENKCL